MLYAWVPTGLYCPSSGRCPADAASHSIGMDFTALRHRIALSSVGAAYLANQAGRAGARPYRVSDIAPLKLDAIGPGRICKDSAPTEPRTAEIEHSPLRP